MTTTSEHRSAAHDHGQDHAADIDKQVRIYITVFVALMALTIVTVASLVSPPADGNGHRRGAAGRHDQGIAGGLLLHAPHLREEADLRGAGRSRRPCSSALLALPVFTHSNGYWIH